MRICERKQSVDSSIIHGTHDIFISGDHGIEVSKVTHGLPKKLRTEIEKHLAG